MLRWKYILPRLVLVGGLLAGLWLASNPMLHWLLVRSGQQVLGAKVEIDELRSLLSHAELQLHHIQIADPHAPLQNLIEADAATLDVSTPQLLRRRLVINRGHLQGVQFKTARRTSGAISGSAAPPAASSWSEGMAETGEAWLAQAASQLESTLQEDLESVALGRHLMQRWPQEYDRLEADVRSLGDRSRKLAEDIEQTRGNPLQAPPHYLRLLQEIEALHGEVGRVRERFASLEQQMQLDRLAIREAKEHDVEYLEQHLRLTRLEPEAISDYLLGPQWGPRVRQLVHWLQWGRQQLSSPAEGSVPTRGEDLMLAGMPSHPSMLLKQLAVDGSGTHGDGPFSFEGTIRGLTNQPRIYGKPASVQFESTGSLQMLVDAVLDHSQEIPQDRITIKCPQLQQPARVLGSADQFAVNIEPGPSSLEMELDARGDQLQGVVHFRQPAVQMNAHLGETLANLKMTERIRSAVESIEQLEALVTVGGTLQQPTLDIDSNLGERLAGGLQAAFRDEIEARQQELVAQANQQVDAQLLELQEKIVRKQRALLKELQLDDDQISAVKQELASLNVTESISEKVLGEKGLLKDWLRR